MKVGRQFKLDDFPPHTRECARDLCTALVRQGLLDSEVAGRHGEKIYTVVGFIPSGEVVKVWEPLALLECFGYEPRLSAAARLVKGSIGAFTNGAPA